MNHPGHIRSMQRDNQTKIKCDTNTNPKVNTAKRRLIFWNKIEKLFILFTYFKNISQSKMSRHTVKL